MNTKGAFTIAMLIVSLLLVFSATQAQGEVTTYTPTGPYAVGVTSRQWIDENRDEIYTADPDDNKMVTVWIWYPADVEEGAEPAPYVADPDEYWAIGAISGMMGLDQSETDAFMSEALLSAYQDAPVAMAMEQYPVVVYFDPLSGLPVNQSMQIQDLASHGYIVVSILHAFGYQVTLAEEVEIGDARFDYTFADYLANAVPDVSFAIDQLDVLNAEEQFAERLDLDNVGLSGYSLGGSVAAMATAQDDRIKATVSQDGLPAEFEFGSITQPYLIFQAEGDFESQFALFGGPTYLLASDQLSHNSFADYFFWSNNLELPGNIVDASRGTEIINTYLIAFFDRYLKGEEQELLQGLSDDYPEVVIESRNVED